MVSYAAIEYRRHLHLHNIMKGLLLKYIDKEKIKSAVSVAFENEQRS